ncbi:acetolactate decarboxylase [Ulvibacterium marinum]|uniref:acetolactate decarboxylase n=1 Tax=Ulvibacterium marinum TaxID=2419782 RepID=UPI002494A597|nr:acetolactate decarboxylase [Ulvibacterium marinum]
MKSNFIIVSVLLFLIGCKPNNQNTDVKYSGALRTMMSGDIKATASLDSLSKKQHLYALGAFENLKGEIQIFDGKALNAVVEAEELVFDTTFDKKAALLVYAEVSDWSSVDIPDDINSSAKLEKFIEEQANKNGIDTEKPIPFLIEGNAQSLSWHVINWKDGDTEHTHQKHQESGLNGIEKNKEVEIIGFFSKSHKAVFTHHTTFLHMHFKTDDNKIAGHIDDLEIGNEMLLKLPAK